LFHDYSYISFILIKVLAHRSNERRPTNGTEDVSEGSEENKQGHTVQKRSTGVYVAHAARGQRYGQVAGRPTSGPVAGHRNNDNGSVKKKDLSSGQEEEDDEEEGSEDEGKGEKREEAKKEEEEAEDHEEQDDNDERVDERGRTYGRHRRPSSVHRSPTSRYGYH
jgi:cobalamin biosynthesis protein CobT